MEYKFINCQAPGYSHDTEGYTVDVSRKGLICLLKTMKPKAIQRVS